MFLQLFDLLIAERLQLMAHLGGDPIELPTADRHFGELLERGGGVLERRFPGTGAQGLFLNRRTKAMGIQVQRRALRGKDRADRLGNGTWVHGIRV